MPHPSDTPFDLERSLELAKEIKAQVKECYKNAFKALSHLDATEGPICYVEGFVVLSDIPLVIEHGWLTHKGLVIDPTPAMANPTPRCYVPYKSYTRTEAVELASTARSLPIALAHTATPWRDPAYHTAYKEAQAYAMRASSRSR